MGAHFIAPGAALTIGLWSGDTERPNAENVRVPDELPRLLQMLTLMRKVHVGTSGVAQPGYYLAIWRGEPS